MNNIDVLFVDGPKDKYKMTIENTDVYVFTNFVIDDDKVSVVGDIYVNKKEQINGYTIFEFLERFPE
jgi:hypothetical protein